MEKQTEEKLIQWHPAFYAAIQLVFKSEKEHLEFEAEHVLNTKPLLIDVVVIKKPSRSMLENSLGRLFKGYNIIEYKSPQDSMDVDTYFKTYAYACLYKATGAYVDEIKMDDVTITMIRNGKPKRLFSYFQDKNYHITNPYPGIYYVKKEGMFDTQIVVGAELQDEEQIWLKVMAPNMKRETLVSFIKKIGKELKPGNRTLMDSVLQVVTRTNKEKMEQLKGDGEVCEAFRELMKDEIKEILSEKEKAAKEAAEEAAKEAAKEVAEKMATKMIRAGKPDDEIMQFTELTREQLDSLKERLLQNA